MAISGYHFGRAKTAALRGSFDGLRFISLNGQIDYGPTQGAVFHVGRSFVDLEALTGHQYGDQPRPLGYALGIWGRVTGAIPPRRIEALAIQLRRAQIGEEAAATFRNVRGLYRGAPEQSMELAFIYTGADGSFEVFQKNMLKLGEVLAYAFAQREVFIELQSGTEHRTHSVTPEGFPPPGDALSRFIDAALRKEVKS